MTVPLHAIFAAPPPAYEGEGGPLSYIRSQQDLFHVVALLLERGSGRGKEGSRSEGNGRSERVKVTGEEF